MSHLFQNTLALLTTLGALALPLTGFPSSARAELLPRPSEIEALGDDESVYSEAREELPENLYVLYRIVERIARANNLDRHPWRVVMADDSLINAYATEVNLIIVHYGLLDQMAGDVSALACVVGHEMAHHTERHIAIRTSRSADWQEEYKRPDDRELQERLAELSRTHESDADAIGYTYSATAGFDATGCLRGLEILSRLPGTLRDSSTHPAVPHRIEAIEMLMIEQPADRLQDTGRSNLENSDPLTYEMIEDQNWLRINSERGGSFVEDWNAIFPDATIAPKPEEPEAEVDIDDVSESEVD
ncbi:MAG: M48 family metalloprotease [Spirulina sp. SIO3F2]|nr:M48 family metalloprotease [Spirulina sp. SIO3F2]